MLINALYSVILIALAALTMLSAGIAMTRVSIHRTAQTFLASEYARALGSLRQTLESDLLNGALPSPFPTFTPLPPACIGTNCAYSTSATIAFVGTATSQACDASHSNCAANGQANPYVAESRMTARIAVVVRASDGTVLATRADDVTLRTLNAPPYIAIVGARDGTFDGIATSTAGDDGGALPVTPDPCAPATPGTTDDTVVRVAYENKATNACTNGSAWRSAAYDVSGSAPSGWSP